MTVAATGASQYQFPFIGVAASDINVLYTATNGTATTVSPTAYTVSLNAPVTGSIWGIGGTISPVIPSNYISGSLTITRTLPFTQQAEISNQGNQYPIVTETALDTLCMEIQQVAARTGAYRGVWVTGTVYNFGDIVQDGVNGAYTNNIYVAAQGNTSGVWATDLAAGDWVLAISVATLQPPGSFLPLTGGTVSGNLTVSGTTTLAAFSATNISASGTLGATGHTTFEGITSTGATGTGNLVYGNSPTLTGAPLVPTAAKGTATTQVASAAFVKAAVTPAPQVYTSGSGTYTVPAGTNYLRIRLVGGGGGGGGTGTSGIGASGTGGTSSFGSTLAQATGGAGGQGLASGGPAGGAGGVGSLGTFNIVGGMGGGNGGTSAAYVENGGIGGSSAFGGAGSGNPSSVGVGSAGAANTGGGGGGASSGGGAPGGGGGGAGGYSEIWVTSPAASYAYVVGAGGTAGTAGAGGANGGLGGSGVIIIEAF